jgi:DHA2 family multidrug resistance protein
LDFKWLDSRLVSFIGLLCVLIASVGASYLDVHWNREQFYLWMLFLSIGEAAIVVPLLMMATNTVKGPHEGPFASALVNAPRAVAETAGVWLLQLIFRFRGGLHGDRIVDHLGSQTYLRLSGKGGHLLATVGSVGASPREIAELAARVQIQALILTISDGYLIVAALAVGLMIWVSTFPERTYPPRIQFARH